ncbi:MAG: hypothetical protein HY231_13635 [Acidobacteria bacterium]|nr:hypothetical protein [Acidobacteriota bacterium]
MNKKNAGARKRPPANFWTSLALVVLLMALAGVMSAATCEAVNQESRSARPAQSRALAEGETITGSKPALPRPYVDTPSARPARRTLRIKASASAASDLQAALDAAMPGDVILLEAGATYTGNFVLPKKSSTQTDWIVIRTAAQDSALPPKGVRVDPEAAKDFPKIVSPNADPALSTAAGAHHFRFLGIEFALAPQVSKNYGLVTFGSNAINALELLPQDLVIDRCYIHGHANADLFRGVVLNCARGSVFDSYISECHVQGFDAQAIACWNGTGPFNITNNYLEASGENIMFGGADPKITNLVPADIVFRGNLCSKPLPWKVDDPSYAGKHWSVKNLFELKNARRVLVEGNIFENNWVDAQSGLSILFTPRNQEGTAPWSAVEDVTFTNNIVRHVSGGVNILGLDNLQPSQQIKRIAIYNNLFEDVNGKNWGGGNGVFLTITDAVEVTIDHNTVLQSGNILNAYGKPSAGVVFTNNLVLHNEYGIIGDGTGTGQATLDKYFTDLTFKKNVLVGGQPSKYPAKNFFPAQLSEVGFINAAEGNFELALLSLFRGLGTDGKDIGCDVNLLKAALNLRSRKPAGSGGDGEE